MAIEYIGTTDIKVFPSAFRNGDAEAKRTTEENLIKFNRLSSSDENLEQMFTDPDDSDYVIFNIHGYWFRCLKTSIPLGNNLFAYIKLEKVGVGWTLSAIPASALDDESDNFTGLGFDATIPDDEYDNGELIVKYYGLKVRDENGEIIEQKLKLTSDEIRNKNTNRSIREELTTTAILAEEINADNISVSETISAGNVQSNSITSGDITADSVQTDQLKVSTITAENAGVIITIDKNIKTEDDKTIDIDGNVDINGNLTIGSGGLLTGTKPIEIDGDVDIDGDLTIGVGGLLTGTNLVNMTGEVTIPIGSKIDLGNSKGITIKSSEIKLGNISIESSTSGTIHPVEFIVDNSATTKTQIYMPKPLSGTSATLHLPTDVASSAPNEEYIWAQKKLNNNRTNSWYKLGDGSAEYDIIQAQQGGSIAAKINGVAITSTGSDVEITTPLNDSILFPAGKSGEVAFISDIKQWTYLGSAPRNDGGLSFSPENVSEYMVIYTDLSTGKYSDMTEVVYGPVSLVNGMTLPGHVGSSIINCNTNSISIEWSISGASKNYVVVYAR
ncbi:MAG: hypothetical protein M0Q88_00425 [Bacilli bacterium]|nr:hypothetical protein [Bacilli bacterium]